MFLACYIHSAAGGSSGRKSLMQMWAITDRSLRKKYQVTIFFSSFNNQNVTISGTFFIAAKKKKRKTLLCLSISCCTGKLPVCLHEMVQSCLKTWCRSFYLVVSSVTTPLAEEKLRFKERKKREGKKMLTVCRTMFGSTQKLLEMNLML